MKGVGRRLKEHSSRLSGWEGSDVSQEPPNGDRHQRCASTACECLEDILFCFLCEVRGRPRAFKVGKPKGGGVGVGSGPAVGGSALSSWEERLTVVVKSLPKPAAPPKAPMIWRLVLFDVVDLVRSPTASSQG